MKLIFLSVGVIFAPVILTAGSLSAAMNRKHTEETLFRSTGAVQTPVQKLEPKMPATAPTVKTPSQKPVPRTAGSPKAPQRVASKSSKTNKRKEPPLVLDQHILNPEKEEIKYKEPLDLIELVPVLRDINRMIPRKFSLAEHQVTLAPREINIRHELYNARVRSAEKTSIISLSYSSGLGPEVGTRLEVPLFYSSYLGLTRWEPYPAGNYTMRFTRDGGGAPQELFIRAQTKF